MIPCPLNVRFDIPCTLNVRFDIPCTLIYNVQWNLVAFSSIRARVWRFVGVFVAFSGVWGGAGR